ncbi:MAG: anti-sigma factor [Acidimicrobiales bacterium]
MKHAEVEELLAAYALDAVDPAEMVFVDAHISVCARCRAEVARHRELASMFAASPDEAPLGLWERISSALAEPEPEYADQTVIAPIAPSGAARRGRRRLSTASEVLGALAAAAAALVIVMAVQLSHLDSRVGRLQAAVAAKGLASAVSSALVEPHRAAILTSATTSMSAEVVITPGGQAYWVKSSLPELALGKSYQLWALVNGETVSIGLIGRDPSNYAAFRIGSGASALMVTVEPAGGTSTPTSPVVVRKTIQT